MVTRKETGLRPQLTNEHAPIALIAVIADPGYLSVMYSLFYVYYLHWKCMKNFFESHNTLIGKLSKTIRDERHSSRKLHCEGEIFGLYVHLLNNCESLSYIDIALALQEIETLERLIMMDHYCYTIDKFFWDYRGEFPSRTSGIIIDIIEKTVDRQMHSTGTRYVFSKMIETRLPLLIRFYPGYATKASDLLRDIQLPGLGLLVLPVSRP